MGQGKDGAVGEMPLLRATIMFEGMVIRRMSFVNLGP